MSYMALWEIESKDFPYSGSLNQQIAFICSYGALAPSVHNTQPWEFSLKDGELELSMAYGRSLAHGDATSRQAWVSIGACLENIIRAARCFGFSSTINTSELVKGKQNASIKIQFKKTASRHSKDDLAAIKARFSDRSKFDCSPLSSTIVTRLKKCNQLKKHVKTVVSSDRDIIKFTADLTARGIKAAFSNPSFRGELAGLIQHRPVKPLGFTSASLRLGTIRGITERHIVRYGLNGSTQSEVERKRILSSGGLVFIFANGDTSPYWLEAGQALQSAALEATKLGLGSSFSAAAVEAFDFHEEIESLFKTTARLQAIMRVGVSQGKAVHTPRLHMEQIFK